MLFRRTQLAVLTDVTSAAVLSVLDTLRPAADEHNIAETAALAFAVMVKTRGYAEQGKEKESIVLLKELLLFCLEFWINFLLFFFFVYLFSWLVG